jgi:D-glycero-alpha-D-manno-heptose-7-phosphate kinase
MIDLERPVGRHDHYMAAFGGLRALHIGTGATVEAEALALTPTFCKYVTERLMLFYTGQSRDAGQVLTSQDRSTRESDATVLTPLHKIRKLANDLLESLRDDRPDDIGAVLDAHWQHKRRLSDRVSTPRIDQLHEVVRDAGADGCKLLGAGGGGFLLVAARQGASEQIREAMGGEGARELKFTVSANGSMACDLKL